MIRWIRPGPLPPMRGDHVLFPTSRDGMPSPRLWWRWVKAGRPTHIPVTIKVGKIDVDDDGAVTVHGWTWDFSHVQTPVHVDLLAQDLAERYPESVRLV